MQTYLPYFKREFAKKRGNNGVLARFVLLLSGMGAGKNNTINYKEIKTMKRLLAIFLGVIMILSFSSCGKKDESNSASTSTSVRESATVSESKGETESEKPESSSDKTSETSSESAETPKILVAYFSATNNTERVAGYIAEITGGTLFELVPVNPYTSGDLNYNSSTSRVSREHNDETLRDIELTKVTPENWDSYETIFIGYPIWWGIAAWPVNNFVKRNDFTGKTVIPFATSMSSSMGNSSSVLKEMAGTGNWLNGQRFYSGATESAVKDWLNELNF